MNKVYGFTNEYVAAYPDVYNFDNADVLSVIGGGDQYFTAMLAGAKNVTVFDINGNAWYHFVLKFMAIRYLSYEEFCKFFIEDNLNNIKIYLKIREYLPLDVRKFFDKFRILNLKFSSMKIKAGLLDSLTFEEYQRILPYLNEESFYILKDILNNCELPRCLIDDFIHLALGDERNKSYDIMLLSNIYFWINSTPSDFKWLLDRLNPCVIQALYAWNYYDELRDFERLGFVTTAIPCVRETMDITSNYVLTYKKEK